MKPVIVLGIAQVACCGAFVLGLLLARLAKVRRLPTGVGAAAFFGLPAGAAVLMYWQAPAWWPSAAAGGAAIVGTLAAAFCARGGTGGESASGDCALEAPGEG
jgi:hypothetical protein